MEEKSLVQTTQQLPELNIDDIKKYIAPKATDKELYVFINVCRSYGLNPFKREVHFVKYGDNSPGETVVGYETYIKRAQATGLLNGWGVEIIDNGRKARVTIHRKDWESPFTWEVDKDEFDKGQSSWKRMPLFMLKKVAIGQGFRLCFTESLGGMPYLPEEINGHTSEELKKESAVEPTVELATEQQEVKPMGVIINSVEEGLSKKNRPYWRITSSAGDIVWTFDADLAQKAMETKRVVVLRIGEKNKLLGIEEEVQSE